MRPASLRFYASVALPIVLALAVAGCINLPPVADHSRYFVLTPFAAEPVASLPGPVVGLGRVEIPDYLQPKGIAVRTGPNEIQYSDRLQWAERLDKGIQRVLGANLASQLGAANVSSSPWRRSDVQVEIYVSVQRFETDGQGHAMLEARWRITAPGAVTTLRTDTFRITRPGPRLAEYPDGACAALSANLGDLSREIGTAMRGMTLMPSRLSRQTIEEVE